MAYPKELLEPASPDRDVPNAPLISIAISLKRIADVLEGTPGKMSLVDYLGATLDTASFNHAQNMQRVR